MDNKSLGLYFKVSLGLFFLIIVLSNIYTPITPILKLMVIIVSGIALWITYWVCKDAINGEIK